MNRRPAFRRQVAPPPLRLVVVITFIIFSILTSLSIWLINDGIEPTLMEIAKTRTRQFTRLAINEAVSKKIAEDLDYDQLIQMQTDEQGDVVSVGWNGAITNRVVRNTTNRVQNFLRQLEKGEVPEPGTALDVEMDPDESPTIENIIEDPTLIQIPMGQALGIPILANLGPKIPVNIEVIGDVQSEPIMEREELGINNVLFELKVHMEVNVRVVIPFTTDTTTITSNITIDQRYIEGDVPEFYNGGGSDKNNSTDFSIPIKTNE
ncbi:sporulation protein YunB [Aquibacillus albus]|uniref:Sporulation protein YunB n=1 Tax=Aquibacillus albus TaxID=1168171 RepID=A0ABS2MYK8_9BACI|nr:sporulation protein YunB [Aquibacillus albus]MBM7570972.1 sporulation protein YunB [Aquibacillus albus]